MENRYSLPGTFTIAFNYSGQACYTKVMEIKYGSNQVMYKAVLGSKFSNSAFICWLQRQPQGWTLQLGQDIDQRLVTAITMAIDRRKLLASSGVWDRGKKDSNIFKLTH